MKKPRRTGGRISSASPAKYQKSEKTAPTIGSITQNQRREREFHSGINFCGTGTAEMNDEAIMNESRIFLHFLPESYHKKNSPSYC